MSDLVTLEASYAIAATPPTSHAIGPLAVLLSPSGHYAVEAGETFDISLTINNQGSRGAVIDVYLDETSQEFCQWCSNPYERLALEVGHSSEVRFKVTIPVQTLPGTYDYLIVVDAPNHYPEDTPLRYPATVRVLPPVKSAVNLNDATFATRPETSCDRPINLQANTPTEVQVIVHNRSNRVDQFRLEITDLPEDWEQIIYPEGLGELGLIIDTDHLALNPGVKGLIRLVITCPQAVPAGRYLATLRLRSANEPDLVLMDMLYFEVAAIYDLQVQAEAVIRQVKRQAALFNLNITNAGNTAREITLSPKEDREDPLFNYALEPAQLRIPSMTTAQATLTAHPAGMRRRAWIGRGRQITFRLEVEDHHQLPLPEATVAELLWERRPWWHMALVLLLAAGVVSLAVGLIWWLFLRPPAPPKVNVFGATASTYYQQRGDFVRLNWQIANPQQIQTLELRSQAEQGAIATPPITYDLSAGLPPELADHCVLEKQLSCSNILTGARQPGSYQFTLTVLSKRDRTQPITATTSAIAVLPTPPPEILTFATTQPRYWEALAPALPTSEPTSSAPTSNTVALNWRITFTEPLSHLTLVGRLADGEPLASPQRYDLTEDLPEALEEDCTLTDTELTCRALPTNARTVGTYIFELSVFTSDRQEPIATAATEPTRIVPAPVRIANFTLNGETAPAKYQILLSPATEDPPVAETPEKTIQLAWQVVGGPYTQVEILPSPGSVSLEGTLAYPLTTNTQEVVTLQVTSVSGEQITRSVTLETLQPQLRLPSPSTAAETALPPPPPAPESELSNEQVPADVEVEPVAVEPVESLSEEEPETPGWPLPPAKPSTLEPVKPKTLR
ncbi:MAG: hypothetical protein AAGE59_18615 [Cyanobacteria bacterium P01_F01_bin.86]